MTYRTQTRLSFPLSSFPKAICFSDQPHRHDWVQIPDQASPQPPLIRFIRIHPRRVSRPRAAKNRSPKLSHYS